MSRLKDFYKNEVMDAMTKKFGYKNVMEVPKLEKIVVNMGVGEARENAKLAEVDQYIHFQKRPLSELSHPKKYGFIITNPPYGERLEDKSTMPKLYAQIGEKYSQLDAWSMYLITGYEEAQKYIGKKADKNRKIYNGMLKTYLYQYMGPKPPKKH